MKTKKIILVVFLLSSICISAQTDNNDSLNLVSNLGLSIIDSTDLGAIFYTDWNKKYNAQLISIGFGISSALSITVGLTMSPDKYNPKIKTIFYGIGGACAVISLVGIIMNIDQTKKIRNNYKKLKITPSGIQVNF